MLRILNLADILPALAIVHAFPILGKLVMVPSSIGVKFACKVQSALILSLLLHLYSSRIVYAAAINLARFGKLLIWNFNSSDNLFLTYFIKSLPLFRGIE